MLKYFIFISIILFWSSNFLKAEPVEGGNRLMKKYNQCEQNEMIYKNLSTAPSYIKIKFISSKTGKFFYMIIENTDMAYYLANKHGLQMDKLGRFKDMKAFASFVETVYVPYMTKSEGNVLDVNIDDFKEFVGKIRFGNKKASDEYLNKWIFERPLKLEDLNVRDKREFSQKYLKFDVNNSSAVIKEEYYQQYSSNPAFIALLIDLGYIVGRGDFVPVLWIHKCLK